MAPKLIIEVRDEAGRTLHTVEVDVDELLPGQGTRIHNTDMVSLWAYRERSDALGTTNEMEAPDAPPDNPSVTKEADRDNPTP